MAKKKRSRNTKTSVSIKHLGKGEEKLNATQMKKVKGGGLINQKGSLVSLGGFNT